MAWHRKIKKIVTYGITAAVFLFAIIMLVNLVGKTQQELASAGNEPSPTPVVISDMTDRAYEEHKEMSYFPVEESSIFFKISRDEAGLDTIPRINFEGVNINQRVMELLFEERPYSDEDMKMGIRFPLLITARFQEPIIENISIGTDIDDVIDILGTPSIQEQYFTIYKTNQFYVCFQGSDTVELVNFSRIPKEYEKNILKPILIGLCFDNIYLTEFLDGSSEVSDFFEKTGFIHGGGNYAHSHNGVKIDTLSNVIEIYNNFEGDLYQINKDICFTIKYINDDSNIQGLVEAIQSYDRINKTFDKEGKVSPSGKYIAKYDWITSTHHYFTIRATDHSIPDYLIPAVVSDFEWINDDYIIYTGLFTNLPTIMRVTENVADAESIPLIPGIDELDYDYGINEYHFTIEEIKENTILLKEHHADPLIDDKNLWEFFYSFDNDGKIKIDH